MERKLEVNPSELWEEILQRKIPHQCQSSGAVPHSRISTSKEGGLLKPSSSSDRNPEKTNAVMELCPFFIHSV